MMTTRRATFWFGIGLTATLALLAVVNLCVDPSRVFRSGGPEQRLAKALVAGHHMAGTGNYDERLVQRLIIGERATPPATAVFGSSRIMPAGAALLGSGTFNHAVSGGTLQDAVALIGLYEDRHMIPPHVVLAVDPWVFNAHSQMTDWQSLADSWERQRRRLGLGTADGPTRPGSRNLASTLISLDYFLASLRALTRPGPQADWRETPGDDTPLAVRRADGSLKYPFAPRDDAATTAAAARWAAADAVYALSKYNRLDPDMTALLEAQLDRLASAGSSVRLVLLPFHPAAWKILSARPDMRMVPAAEAHVRGVATRRGLIVSGSYDPARAGCPETSFVDGLHPDIACLARVLHAP